jgi:hypothetical protein
MRNRATLALIATVIAAGCGERPLAPVVAPTPSFDVATERLVIEGPFSLADRVEGDFEPVDLNDRGDVLGFASDLESWGILPDGMPFQPAPEITAGGESFRIQLRALNQVGVAAGEVRDRAPSGELRGRPVLWSPGSDPEAGPYLPGEDGQARIAIGSDVNDAGMVVGWFGDDLSPSRPYRWMSGAMSAEVLDVGGADDGRARAINSGGVIVGTIAGSGARWSPAGEPMLLPDLQYPVEMNDGGQIAGHTGTSALCATLWDADLSIRFQAACGPTSVANAIDLNDLGHFLYQEVTDAYGAPTVQYRLWVEGWPPAALPPLAGTIETAAVALNNRGTILGAARSAEFTVVHAVFWTYRIEAVPPDELVEELVDAVDAAEAAGTLGSGNANALRAKLDAASRHLAAGRCAPAAMVLEAFINQVDALERSGALSPAEAADLRDAANAAVAEIIASCRRG